MSVPSKCMIPGCNNMYGGDKKRKGGRGLCSACHQAASMAVKKKQTTWTELEELGLAKCKLSSAFNLALIEARKRKLEEDNVRLQEMQSNSRTEPTNEEGGQVPT